MNTYLAAAELSGEGGVEAEGLGVLAGVGPPRGEFVAFDVARLRRREARAGRLLSGAGEEKVRRAAAWDSETATVEPRRGRVIVQNLAHLTGFVSI